METLGIPVCQTSGPAFGVLNFSETREQTSPVQRRPSSDSSNPHLLGRHRRQRLCITFGFKVANHYLSPCRPHFVILCPRAGKHGA